MAIINTDNPELTKLQGLHLWHAGLSTCSQRVRIALAELGLGFEGHTVNLHAGENASEWYQAIHPDGVVPALVDDGQLVVESVDIIDYLDQKQATPQLTPADNDQSDIMHALMERADQAQKHLKLLTFEYLFSAVPAIDEEKARKFQANHSNEWLKAFHRDFRAGFDRDRVRQSANATDEDFKYLDQLLSDGREFLTGPSFSLADIAWTPNFHRLDLIGWPFERYPDLQNWFSRMCARPSYSNALEDWEPGELLALITPKLAARKAAGDGVESYIS
jgi:glutathione S-transferase